MASAIDITDLTKRFGHVTALDGLDLSVRTGEVHGFLGPNGAGKSTTIRVLLGLLRPDAGQTRVLGADAWRDAVALHRRHVVRAVAGVLRPGIGDRTFQQRAGGGRIIADDGGIETEVQIGVKFPLLLHDSRNVGGFDRLCDLVGRDLSCAEPVDDRQRLAIGQFVGQQGFAGLLDALFFDLGIEPPDAVLAIGLVEFVVAFELLCRLVVATGKVQRKPPLPVRRTKLGIQLEHAVIVADRLVEPPQKEIRIPPIEQSPHVIRIGREACFRRGE